MPFLKTAFISPSGGELITIMLVMILLFGAKDAPKVFRRIQALLDKMQRGASDFRYKMMYGDIHANTTGEKTHNVEDVDPVLTSQTPKCGEEE